MAPKIPPAGPLTGSETAIVIQAGRPVRTTAQDIANRGPAATVPPVTSVAGKTGDVALVKADVGLNNVNNTADLNKPVSTSQQAAIDKAKPRIARFTGTTVSTGVATITFSPAFDTVPDIDVIDGWSGDQMVTGAVVAGSATKSGCQVQVMLSRGTLLLTSGPFQKAGPGVSVTVRAIAS